MAIAKRDSQSSTTSSTLTPAPTPPASPSGVEVNPPFPWRGWKRHDEDAEKRGLDLLGLGGNNNSDSEDGDDESAIPTTPTSDLVDEGGSNGEEENWGYRGWAKRGDDDIESTTSLVGNNQVTGRFVKLAKRQEGDEGGDVEKNIGGPYRGYKA